MKDEHVCRRLGKLGKRWTRWTKGTDTEQEGCKTMKGTEDGQKTWRAKEDGQEGLMMDKIDKSD